MSQFSIEENKIKEPVEYQMDKKVKIEAFKPVYYCYEK